MSTITKKYTLEQLIIEINEAHSRIVSSNKQAAKHRKILNKLKAAHKYDEYGLQQTLANYFEENNLQYLREVTLSLGGRVDFITQKSIIELKHRCNRGDIFQAIGQLLFYTQSPEASSLSLVIVSKGSLDIYMTRVLKELNIAYYDIDKINELEIKCLTNI